MRALFRITNASRYFFEIRLILLLIALAYIVVYFAIPATPGNAPYDHPLGWWGWFDQGKYLLSANAFAQGDFDPSKHFYPPLYPAIGAIFLKWSSGHSFFLFNLAALLYFTYVFVRFADRYIPRWASVVLFFFTTVFNYAVFENYVIPWTSTLSAALVVSGILGLIWLYEVRDGLRFRIGLFQVFFVSVCLGLIAPTRPTDALAGMVIGFGLLTGYWQSWRNAIPGIPPISYVLPVAIAGSIIGPVLFLSFNTVVFGSPFGGYIQSASVNGFFPADLAEKFVSLWLDGFTLYGEPNAGLTERYPWLFLSLAGLVWVLIRGDGPLRSVASAIVVLFLLYLPYGDLLPNGLWRYLNIHYFKWTFPFLGLFALLLIKQVLVAWRRKERRILPIILLVGIPFLLLSLRFVVDASPISTRIMNNSAIIEFDLNNGQIDLIDINGLSGGFTDIYFGSHQLWLDGRQLKPVKDFRLLPMVWGVRLLFVRPITGHSVQFSPDQRLTRHPRFLSAQLGTYRFALGSLKPFRRLVQPEIVADYCLGEVIDFSQQGNGELYVTRGWSHPEPWGTWTEGPEAELAMWLTPVAAGPLKLTVRIDMTMIDRQHSIQAMDILANGLAIGTLSIQVSDLPLRHEVIIPSATLKEDGLLRLIFRIRYPMSPKASGQGEDQRLLGIGISQLQISEASPPILPLPQQERG